LSSRSLAGSRTPSRTLTLALALALAVGLFTPAHAQDPDEMRRELSQVERRAAELADRTKQVERELAETREKLAALEQRLAEVTERLVAAQEREQRATEDAELARGQAEHALRQLTRSEDALSENSEQLGGLARDTYKYGAPRSSVVSVVGSVTIDEGPGQISDAIHYLNRGIGQWSLLVEQSEALVVQVDAASERAEQERLRREALLAEAAAAREEIAVAHAEAADLVSEASLQQHRQQQLIVELEEARAEARARIGTLQEQIEAEERRRAEEEARRRAEEEARRKAEEEARQRAAAEAQARAAAEERRREEERARQQRASAPAASAPKPSAPKPTAPKPTAPKAESSSSTSSSSTSSAPRTTMVDRGSGLVTVGGITVASSLGPNLRALLDAARADGIVLGGNGWRSPDAQAALRIANGCRDVYTAPASSCRVPTAIPGSSEHEKGLAVDFTWNGATICYPRSSSNCTGNAAFDWLRANAGKYGLRNLPAEAWHWSTTGR
jgi:zinc D-Ala-D-Ala carboxypeptidase